MMREMYAEILGHQLKGIMFHADAFAVSVFNGYSRLKWCHCFQLRTELDAHTKTLSKIIEECGDIIDPKQKERIKIPRDATPNQILDMWEKWERETVELYAEAMAQDDCRLWKKLYSEAKHELIAVSNML